MAIRKSNLKNIIIMKIKVLLLLGFLSLGLHTYAQDRSVFRKGYMRVGLNKLGDDLSAGLTPKENVFDGRYGAKTGYVFEFGRIYYFKGKQQTGTVNYGLDWTMLSLNYNKMDNWDDYAAASGMPDADVDGTRIAAAVSSKIGPVISLNPVEKLVIDLRFQVTPTWRFFDLSYSEEDESGAGRYFSFINDSQEDFDGESVKNRIGFGLATNYGITVRRKALGLSLDYVSGKVKSTYEAFDDQSGGTFGKAKIPANNLQLKLSFTL